MTNKIPLTDEDIFKKIDECHNGDCAEDCSLSFEEIKKVVREIREEQNRKWEKLIFSTREKFTEGEKNPLNRVIIDAEEQGLITPKKK